MDGGEELKRGLTLVKKGIGCLCFALSRICTSVDALPGRGFPRNQNTIRSMSQQQRNRAPKGANVIVNRDQTSRALLTSILAQNCNLGVFSEANEASTIAKCAAETVFYVQLYHKL